jgi:peptide-methionine (R)-S-oxide reductase
MTAFDMTPPTESQRREITAGLKSDERRVLLEHGTEAAFCGVFLDNKKDGIYTCRFCGLPLFRSSAKFDSGTGWPSFFQPYDEAHIKRIRDSSYGMVRVEEVCARCGSHLGHVFPDGPRPTGERHCLNSVSLSFSGPERHFPMSWAGERRRGSRSRPLRGVAPTRCVVAPPRPQSSSSTSSWPGNRASLKPNWVRSSMRRG